MLYLGYSCKSGKNCPYKKANIDGGCCISNEVFAERCHCSQDRYICRERCQYDDNCRGYVNKVNGDCQAITTTQCDRYSRSKCKKFNEGNIADLDLSATCGTGYEGCVIKRIGKCSKTANLKPKQ